MYKLFLTNKSKEQRCDFFDECTLLPDNALNEQKIFHFENIIEGRKSHISKGGW
jgi:hypothetical protein